MPSSRSGEFELRVLVVPPTARDGQVTLGLLARVGLQGFVCENVSQLCEEVRCGAGAVLLTGDALLPSENFAALAAALSEQPSWSDLPFVVLMSGREQTQIFLEQMAPLGNVMLLEKPAPIRSVVSAVQTAVRSRQRQYQIRDHIEASKQAANKARELREQLAMALDASDLGTFHCTLPLGEILWNDRCKLHFGLPPEASVDIDLFYALLHPADRVRTQQAVEQCVTDRKPYDIEYRVLLQDGQTRWLRATGRTYCDSAGVPIRFDGTTQDITERKQAEAELAESRERFEAMANFIPQLAWIAKPDGELTWYNERWHAYCGSSPAGINGSGWTDVIHPEELPRVVDGWQLAVKNGEPWEDSFPLRRHDGEYRWHLSRAMPFSDKSGNIAFWFGTNTDITEQQKSALIRQEQLEAERKARAEAERVSRMKDEFLATLSHELRTPLNAIFGWTQLVKMDLGNQETLSQGIEVIDRNVRLQTQLIEDLLDMSRIVSGKIRLDVQSVELPRLIESAMDAVKPAADAKSLRLEKVIDPLAGPVSGDPSRLQQILWNLLTNAIKFTPKGGKVQVVLERVNSHISIRVVDSGPGISPEFLPHLFERFSQEDASTTRKHGGLGLGLSIVKNLVELHGGTIQAESDGANHGSTFVVQLPLRATVAAKKPDERHPRTPVAVPTFEKQQKLRGIKVLVVDDEPDARKLVKRFLTECGASAELAASAAEAQALLADFSPDVIVSDIGMPEQDGYEFIRTVRSNGNRIPAVALTAFARAEDRIRSIQAGFQTHLPKPVEPAELIAIVASLAGR